MNLNPAHPFTDQTPAFPPPQAGGGTNWRVVGLVVVGVGLLGLVACSGLVYLGIRGISNRPPTAAEKQAVVTVSDLAPFGARPERLAEREVWNVKQHLDGALELTYEYDADRAPSPGDHVFVSSSCEIAPSESAARESFTLTKGALAVGLTVGGVQAEELSQSISGVDQSHVALLRSGGNPVGNMVVVRQGDRVFGLLIVGLYFETAAELESILQPKIAAAASLER